MIKREYEIINMKGLHARASAKFVEVVEAHTARADVSKDGMDASGDSIMGLLMLAAEKGSTIEVTINGDDEAELADALGVLISGYFDEGM